MPVYEYECLDCKKRVTFVRGIQEKDPGYKCTTCNLGLTRVYSLGAVTFNGGGFYSTDSRGK
jgi:putative FmdB family regulatory protein